MPRKNAYILQIPKSFITAKNGIIIFTDGLKMDGGVEIGIYSTALRDQE